MLWRNSELPSLRLMETTKCSLFRKKPTFGRTGLSGSSCNSIGFALDESCSSWQQGIWMVRRHSALQQYGHMSCHVTIMWPCHIQLISSLQHKEVMFPSNFIETHVKICSGQLRITLQHGIIAAWSIPKDCMPAGLVISRFFSIALCPAKPFGPWTPLSSFSQLESALRA